MSSDKLCGYLGVTKDGKKVGKKHPHNMKRQDVCNSGWGCDGHCRKRSGFTEKWKCNSGCNITICGQCMVEAGGELPKPLPDVVRVAGHEHLLEKQKKSSSWSCDNKSSSNHTKEERFRCAEKCDFDFCGECVRLGFEEAKLPEAPTFNYPHHKHPLVKNAKGGNWRCDGKGGTPHNRERYTCESCDYDCCGNCVNKECSADAKEDVEQKKTPEVSNEKKDAPKKEDTAAAAKPTPKGEEVVQKKEDSGGLTPLPDKIWYTGGKGHKHALYCADKNTSVNCDGHLRNHDRKSEKWKCAEKCNQNTYCALCVRDSYSTEQPAGLPDRFVFIGKGDVPPHKHPLAKKELSGNWGCDCCTKSRYGPRDASWCCSFGCDFCVCEECVPQAHRAVTADDEKKPVFDGSVMKFGVIPSHEDGKHVFQQMEGDIEGATYKCGLCNYSCGKGSGSEFRCVECNDKGRNDRFRVCQECFVANALDLSAPENKKFAQTRCQFKRSASDPIRYCAMREASGNTNGWSCDVCSELSSNVSKMYQCKWRHDYALCDVCVAGESRVKKEAPKTITPGPASLSNVAELDFPDARRTKLWPMQQKFAGQWVFATESIEQTMEPEKNGQITDAFAAGDSVYGRAVWHKAIRNFALATTVDGGKPVYGPQVMPHANMKCYSLERLLLFKVNGEPVVNRVVSARRGIPGISGFSCQFHGPRPNYLGAKECQQMMTSYDPPVALDPADFYASNVSLRVNIVQGDDEETTDWTAGSVALRFALFNAGVGKHKVDVELRYRIAVDEEERTRLMAMNYFPKNADGRVDPYPYQTTEVSHPISVGSFTYTINDQSELAKVYPPVLPRRNSALNDADCDRIEKVLASVIRESPGWGKRGSLTEELFSVKVQGGWGKRKSHQCGICQNNSAQCKSWQEEPWKHTLSIEAAFYRSPLKGWEKEQAVTFRLVAESLTQDFKHNSDCVGLGVGGHEEFDPEMITPEEFEAAELKRCPENLRDGVQ